MTICVPARSSAKSRLGLYCCSSHSGSCASRAASASTASPRNGRCRPPCRRCGARRSRSPGGPRWYSWRCASNTSCVTFLKSRRMRSPICTGRLAELHVVEVAHVLRGSPRASRRSDRASHRRRRGWCRPWPRCSRWDRRSARHPNPGPTRRADGLGLRRRHDFDRHACSARLRRLAGRRGRGGILGALALRHGGAAPRHPRRAARRWPRPAQRPGRPARSPAAGWVAEASGAPRLGQHQQLPRREVRAGAQVVQRAPACPPARRSASATLTSVSPCCTL